MDKDLQSIQETRELLRQARQAQRALAGMSQEQLDKITAAIAAAAGEHARRLADMAVEETGFGKKEDKELKNRFAATTLYEAIRDERTHGILAENREKRTIDIGVPVGIVAGLVPSTNPTSTVIYKSMICMKAGNPIIFSPHPSAVNCILETVNVVRRAAEGAGAPAGSISCITTPTLEATNALMRHDDTRLILATGGGAMVKAAYSSGTPAIGVGAGNGPAYIHHTADVRLAVKRILDSKTFDNGTICASEQSIVVERRMEGAVTAELKAQGAYLLDDEEHRLLSKFILRPNGTMNPAIVGKSVETVAKLAGLTRVPPTARVLVARETGVGPGYPYSNEKLGLILAYYVEAAWRSWSGRARATPSPSTPRMPTPPSALPPPSPPAACWSTPPPPWAASGPPPTCSPPSPWGAARWAARPAPTTSGPWISSTSSGWPGASKSWRSCGGTAPRPGMPPVPWMRACSTSWSPGL